MRNLSNLEIILPKIEDQQRIVDEIKEQTQTQEVKRKNFGYKGEY